MSAPQESSLNHATSSLLFSAEFSYHFVHSPKKVGFSYKKIIIWLWIHSYRYNLFGDDHPFTSDFPIFTRGSTHPHLPISPSPHLPISPSPRRVLRCDAGSPRPWRWVDRRPSAPPGSAEPRPARWRSPHETGWVSGLHFSEHHSFVNWGELGKLEFV